ncbi:MAG TPA: hypothetical protein PLQ93_08430 [Bacteroidia bacterium]|nr:hypothetical protein [Bacteroidia bacterium]
MGFLSIVVSFPRVFSPEVKKLGSFMPALFGLLVAANFMSYIGLWFMKRWGAELFCLAYFIKTLLDLVLRQFGFSFYLAQAFSLFCIVVILLHYRKLDRNL